MPLATASRAAAIQPRPTGGAFGVRTHTDLGPPEYTEDLAVRPRTGAERVAPGTRPILVVTGPTGERHRQELVIRGGTVADGTGAPTRTADVAVTDGLVTEVGRVDGPATREIDADGALVTPGFVDIHTHYDGQVTWDPLVTPSGWHGVTTVIMGNCGVGFAPCTPDRREWLIGLMEGVEDIPGSALLHRHQVVLGELPRVPRRPRRPAQSRRHRHPGPPRRRAGSRHGRAGGPQ